MTPLRSLSFLISLPLAPMVCAAGPYAPAAGIAGTDAVAKDDSRFVAWASGHRDYLPGTDVDEKWRTPAKAYGPATGSNYDIVCLGNGGAITLWFPHPVKDGPGADFAVFENSFNATFLELAFVEVSSDGVNFVRFPSASLTAGPVGAFGSVDPTNLSGLAGKYQAGYGTPFDLAALPATPGLDRQAIRFVRIVDIIGDGAAKDSAGHAIYDPFPTTGSGGFDLEAVGVIHQNDGDFQVLQAGVQASGFVLAWESNPGSRYRIESSTGLSDWTPGDPFAGSSAGGVTQRSFPLDDAPRKFWRIVRIDD